MKTTYKKLLAKAAQYEKKDGLVRLSASSGAGTKKIQAALLRGKAVYYRGKSEGGVAHVALYYQTSGGKVKALEAKVDVTTKKPKAKKPVAKVVHKRPSKKTLKAVKKPVVKKPRVSKPKPGDARRRTVAAKPAAAKHQARLARARAKRQAERGRTFVPDPEKYQRTVKDTPRYAAPGQGVQVRVGLAPAGQVWWDQKPSGGGTAEALRALSYQEFVWKYFPDFPDSTYATRAYQEYTATGRVPERSEALHTSAYDDAYCATCGRDADGCVCDECDCEMCSSLGHGGKGFEYLRHESLPAKAKKIVGENGGFLYAIQIDGLDPIYLQKGFGRQEIAEWKKGAKSDWISTKPRKGQKPATELRRWLAAVNPSEFWAKWDLRVDDDTREIFYKTATTSESLPLPPDEHDVSHLVQIAVNDGELYRKRTQPSLINLQIKYRQGQYDPNAAIIVWRLLADDARRQYAKEFGAEAARVFNGPVRDAAARELEAYYRDIIAGSENA
jgi:hypothetical protein